MLSLITEPILKFLLVTLLFLPQACSALEPSSAPSNQVAPAQLPSATASTPSTELVTAVPSLLVPAVPEAEIVKLEPGLNIRPYFDKMRVKNIGGADQSINQALDLKRITFVILVKPGCIYCDSLLAVMKGTRLKSKSQANIIFVTDSAHASQDEFKAKAETNRKLGKWLYDYSDKFAEIFGVTAFPQFIVVGKDGKLIKYQKGLVVPENKETLVGKDTAVVLQTLGRSTLKWLEQF